MFCAIVFHSIACSVATKCIDQHFFVVGRSGTSNFLKRDRQHAVVEDYPIKKLTITITIDHATLYSSQIILNEWKLPRVKISMDYPLGVTL